MTRAKQCKQSKIKSGAKIEVFLVSYVQLNYIAKTKQNTKVGSRQMNFLKDSLLEKQFHENIRCQKCNHDFSGDRRNLHNISG